MKDLIKRIIPSFVLLMLFTFILCLMATVAPATEVVQVSTASGFEGAAQAFLLALMDKVPIALTVYLVLSAAYNLFCVIAALTKTDKDDKIASFLKVFFSLTPPPKK